MVATIMPVPSTIADLSTSNAANSPQDTETGSTLNGPDDYLRALSGIQKRLVSQGADITASATLAVPVEGAFFFVTGSASVTGIAANFIARKVVLEFAGVCTLNHSSTFKLPGSANYVTAAGDIGIFVQRGVSSWACVQLVKADGTLLGAADSTAATALATANTAQATANSALSTANSAITQSGSAQTTANSASAAASSAQTIANAATSTANGALATANSAQSTANSTASSLSYHSSDTSLHLSNLHSGYTVTIGTITLKFDSKGRITSAVDSGGGGVGGP